VDIYLGPDRVHFHVHQKLLCQVSPVFDKMFNGYFQEAENKSAILPEDDPETFDTFLRWAYSNALSDVNMKESKTNSGPLWARIKLFCFAEKYCADALMDYAIDSIMDAFKSTNLYPSVEGIHLAYSNTSDGSGLRLYMARSFVHRLINRKLPYDENGLKQLASIIEFSQDVFVIMAKGAPSHPNDAPRCDYHRHGEDKACTTRSLVPN
jgi:hypothetical protein